ncbi:MAG: alpha/beta hydrolase family protein [Candidatus Thiodiazotropha sp. (ex Lucinoma annulata)]|nr:alpha/beta hydrolase family protein [Candidatus Thiodiazotropha sp. (ex Troendleina suluensis)]MCU7883849.1 alpha/beta hydrolase family protein [Candidatus Thiodiazotropha sp. (ex Lucinoma annulata)]MCU7947551.1 alpha/beta hydrolase family protein [Candidatus Thiodiazotropha sp. (ex Cardiolucina cf. quadrata)]
MAYTVRMRLILLVITCFAALIHASNLSLEARISETIDAESLDGKALWLDAGPIRFLALLKETAAEKRHGGVILLHDAGGHADWHEVINPLRIQLAAHGWDTLSLQLPVSNRLPDQAMMKQMIADASPRIQAAIDYFNNQQNKHLTLVGHGLGASMALNHLLKQPETFSAVVMIGLPMTQDDTQDPVQLALSALDIPLLDLYGSQDLTSVVQSAGARRSIARKAERKKYRQDRVTGADHYFSGLQENLLIRVRAWLNGATSGAE